MFETFQVQENIVAIFHDKLARKAWMLPRKQLWLAGTKGSRMVCVFLYVHAYVGFRTMESASHDTVVAKASRVHDTESHECVEEKISSLLQAKGSEHGYLTRLSSF